MFKETPYLSKILEESEGGPAIIFKYSSTCGTSSILKEKLEDAMKNDQITVTIYIVTVQEMPVLSRKIEDFFNIRHESPQIIIVNKGVATYFKSHNAIDIKEFVYNK